MKILITENKLGLVLKEKGTEKTINLIGGWDNFCNVFNIESPMDFLHLFDNLEQVQSEEKEYWTLFRYKKGHNFMIYNRQYDYVYINYEEIWSFLENKFIPEYSEIKELLEEWLDDVYNLRGVTTLPIRLGASSVLGEVNKLK